MLEGRYAPQALSLLRIVAALIFLLHGSSKILGFPASEMGSPPVGSLMWVGGLLELGGGLLLLIGLFSRPVAFILSGEMAYAYWMFHAPQSTFPMLNGGDAAILYCFVFLLIAAAGPGPWSLDASMRRKNVAITEDAGEPVP
jgi:putative oxidoreductase